MSGLGRCPHLRNQDLGGSTVYVYYINEKYTDYILYTLSCYCQYESEMCCLQAVKVDQLQTFDSRSNANLTRSRSIANF